MEIVGYEMSEIGDEARWRAEGGDQLKKTEPRRQNMEIETSPPRARLKHPI